MTEVFHKTLHELGIVKNMNSFNFTKNEAAKIHLYKVFKVNWKCEQINFDKLKEILEIAKTNSYVLSF